MPVRAFVCLECAVGKARQVATEVARIPGVRLSHAVTGVYDVITFIEVPDIQALGSAVLSRIQAVGGVLRTSTNVVVE